MVVRQGKRMAKALVCLTCFDLTQAHGAVSAQAVSLQEFNDLPGQYNEGVCSGRPDESLSVRAVRPVFLVPSVPQSPLRPSLRKPGVSGVGTRPRITR